MELRIASTLHLIPPAYQADDIKRRLAPSAQVADGKCQYDLLWFPVFCE
jgi:hypothetical protein